MSKILVLNGPNLNLLGQREPDIYGSLSLWEIEKMCFNYSTQKGFDLDFFQTNHEGVLIDKIHEAGVEHSKGRLLGLIFNPGAYTHTSIALHDAIKGFPNLPVIELHLSNIYSREPFRNQSFISPVSHGIIAGFGAEGYILAIQGLINNKN